jgi:hypothetical protein
MTKKTLLQIRTNSSFSVDYSTSNLVPEVELILLFSEPEYQLTTKKDSIKKGNKLSEFRIKTSSEGINQMIGELQTLQVNLQQYEQMSVGLNAVINQNKK